MNGHRTPRHASAGHRSLPSRQRTLTPKSLLLVLLLLALALGGSLLVAGCGSDEEAASTTASTAAPAESAFPVTVADDNGATVTVEAQPMRIVSTAPASTETLFALGLGDKVVGVTSLCDYPAEVADITKIGDFQANTEAIMALSPDLVIGYSGNEEALAPVQDAGAAVIILNPATIEGVYANITAIGAVTGATAEATDLIDSIKAQMAEVTEAAAAAEDSPKVFYALDNTLWTCGPGSFVDEMLSLVNCANVGASEAAGEAAGQAYFQLTPEQLVAADPDVILLPTASGYTSADEFTGDSRFSGLTAVEDGHVYLIDDTTVTRPGPRIGEGLRILAEAIHPGAF